MKTNEEIQQARLRTYSLLIKANTERQITLEKLCADIASSVARAKDVAEAAINLANQALVNQEAIALELKRQADAWIDLADCLQWEETDE